MSAGAVVFFAVIICWAFLTSGCAHKRAMPGFNSSQLPPLSESGTDFTPQRWWITFNDAGLDQQINMALGENFDLAAALYRLRAAQAVTRREASDLFPDLNGLLRDQNTFGPGPDQTRLTWGLDAAYQVDLWGQIRARVDAERFRAGATRADYHTVALALSAEIARTWYALIEGYAQLDLLEQQFATNSDGLKLVEARYGNNLGGEGGGPNVLRQRQLIESTREQQVVVAASIEVLEHQLAVLTGQPPQSAKYQPGNMLPALPPLPYTGLPSELINRRPDVRSAFLELVAADRDAAVAVASQYPRLDLTGSLVNSADRPSDFFQDWFVSIGGQLLGPILDGGQRRAEVARTNAVVCQRFAEYRQTVLIALQEVEDGLALERRQLERIEKLEIQAKWARSAADQLLQYFVNAETDYLDVLSANQSEQRVQRSLISARLDLILIRIGLYLALAGDFDTRPIPAGEEILPLPIEPIAPA
ncbi:MAG TPA: hypothetical protein DDW52_07905, partial [Planctomycetaceae bacterium]|nr:hypothetical protein [Planctomycetaceae bacterium]